MLNAQAGQAFALASDGVDPTTVPTRTLFTGARIPAIGLGTFGSDRYSPEASAAVYGNEHLIGRSLQAAMRGGTRRD